MDGIKAWFHECVDVYISCMLLAICECVLWLFSMCVFWHHICFLADGLHQY